MAEMDIVIEYVWPDSFPDGVPPQHAKKTEGIVFRISNNMPPIGDDFKQTKEEEKNQGNVFQGEHLVNSYGVSVFTDIKDAIKLKRRFENRLSNEYFIATGTLVPELGKMAKTYKYSHHTIWFQENAKPYEYIYKEAEQ